MSRRRGVSLVELMVALALFSILLATTLAFYRQQGAAFTEGNTRMTVMQNLRYAVTAVEQNVRAAGTGVPARQPVVVYAGPDVLAFNADYATNLENDISAVYYDRRLPAAEATALTPDRRITLPGTTFAYPDSAYYVGSGNSPAETIIFFFAPDPSTDRADDWTLFRQVNDQPPVTVARRLLRTDRAFFTYYVLNAGGGGDPIAEIPGSALPTAHTNPLHGAPADTGAVARVDSIRAVRVSYRATNGLTGSDEAIREISRLIRLPNAGLSTRPTCGDRPYLGTALMATGTGRSGSVDGHNRLEWARATDEHGGERDVIRYVIWRRPGGAGPWGDPLASVPAGASSYTYRDFSAEEGVDYTYALAAQDCTPQYSALAVSGTTSWRD